MGLGRRGGEGGMWGWGEEEVKGEGDEEEVRGHMGLGRGGGEGGMCGWGEERMR